MRAAVLAEFNPFHEGHAFLFRTLRDKGAELIVSIMSGDFVQRGGPAFSDKWSRAESAVLGGCDLVLELPSVFAMGSAGHFAEGGVLLAEALCGLDTLAFGSESGDTELLVRTSGLLRKADEESDELRRMIKEGYSYPKAREMLLRDILRPEELSCLRSPNDILAMEYIRHLRTLRPFAVGRSGEGHEASASRIREEIREKDPAVYREREERYFALLRFTVLMKDAEELDGLLSGAPGLGNLLKEEARRAENLEDLTERVKSKAYTRTRVTRLFAQSLIGVTKEDFEERPLYARVLASNERGRAFLRERKKASDRRLPVITKVTSREGLEEKVIRSIERDILVSDIYQIIAGNNDLYLGSDYVKMPYIAHS